MSKVRWRKCLL